MQPLSATAQQASKICASSAFKFIPLLYFQLTTFGT